MFVWVTKKDIEKKGIHIKISEFRREHENSAHHFIKPSFEKHYPVNNPFPKSKQVKTALRHNQLAQK